ARSRRAARCRCDRARGAEGARSACRGRPSRRPRRSPRCRRRPPASPRRSSPAAFTAHRSGRARKRPGTRSRSGGGSPPDHEVRKTKPPPASRGEGRPLRNFGLGLVAVAVAIAAAVAAAAVAAATAVAAAASTAAAAVATAAATAVATAVPARRAGRRFVHTKRPSPEVASVELAHRRVCGVRLRHLHEREATGTTRLAIGDDAHGCDLAVRLEQLAELGLGGGERDVANVQLLTHSISQCDAAPHAGTRSRRTVRILVRNIRQPEPDRLVTAADPTAVSGSEGRTNRPGVSRWLRIYLENARAQDAATPSVRKQLGPTASRVRAVNRGPGRRSPGGDARGRSPRRARAGSEAWEGAGHEDRKTGSRRAGVRAPVIL